MDITLAGGAVTFEPNDDQLGRVSLEFAAFDGEVGVGQLPVPDSTAALTVADGRSARVDEIATRLTDGFIVDQDRVRGPQPAGTAREHSYSVQDANALLDGFRIARSRPSETDYARVIAFAALDGPTWDTTMVINANTATMPAKKYYSDGGWTSELIPDLVEFTGKTLFLHDKANGGRCLHYHTLNSGHACGLTISDVPSAVNGVTVFAPGQPTRNRTSIDLRNSVKAVDQTNRKSIVSDATSIAAHDADGLQHELQVSLEAASQSDLDVKAAALLASLKDERDTYTCIIGPLDATALSLIRVGDLITVTSSVMGLTASSQRIAHMTLTVWSGDGPPAPGLWQAALEMGAPIRRRARVRNRPFVDEPWVCIPTDYAVYTGGDINNVACVIPNSTALNCSSSHVAGNGMTLYSGATYRIEYYVLHYALTSHLVAHIALGSRITEAPADMGSAADPGTWGPPLTYASVEYVAWMTGEAHTHLDGIFGVGTDNANSSISTHITWLSGPDPRFETLPLCSNDDPRPNQRVLETAFLGDGAATTFTTLYAYVSGSLHATVNGLDWTPEVTETDPTTGDYTMAYPFPLNATVIVTYRAA